MTLTIVLLSGNNDALFKGPIIVLHGGFISPEGKTVSKEGHP